MKKYIFITIVSILFSQKVFAQNDSVISKKNEFSIDLIPAIMLFSNITQRYNWRGTIQYKRQVKPSLFFRIGFTAMQKAKAKTYSAPTFYPTDSIHDAATYRKDQSSPEIQLNAGVEYRWGKKRINQFTGLDIGYAHIKNAYTYYYKLTDKYVYYDPSFQSGEIHSINPSTNDSILHTFSNIQNKICFTPFYGVQYHFSKRVFFTMQVGIQVQYVLGKTDTMEDGVHTYTKYRAGGFDAERLLNNFSLAYRF